MLFLQSLASLFLVRGFTGSLGFDLDGALDVEPWTETLDQVAFEDGSADTDVFYATPILTNDGYAAHPIVGSRAGAARRIDGEDTNAEEDWRRHAYAGCGLPGCEPDPTEAWATPGAPNTTR